MIHVANPHGLGHKTSSGLVWDGKALQEKAAKKSAQAAPSGDAGGKSNKK
ncbi:hypothetical protein Acr_02g0008440 [Actinidia rufa]|uniref:Uncharacterized protein n=1 Tax=Actinidia rufa TaxID=165716 RepID=A0A7J0E804_9ERIC|nr:hypothetical protein Acr_02g0008440 [Actinidia rufa]